MNGLEPRPFVPSPSRRAAGKPQGDEIQLPASHSSSSSSSNGHRAAAGAARDPIHGSFPFGQPYEAPRTASARPISITTPSRQGAQNGGGRLHVHHAPQPMHAGLHAAMRFFLTPGVLLFGSVLFALSVLLYGNHPHHVQHLLARLWAARSRLLRWRAFSAARVTRRRPGPPFQEGSLRTFCAGRTATRSSDSWLSGLCFPSGSVEEPRRPESRQECRLLRCIGW